MAFDYDGTGDYSQSGTLYNDNAQVSVFLRAFVPAGNVTFDRLFELGGFATNDGGIDFEFNDSTSLDMGIWNSIPAAEVLPVIITNNVWFTLGYTSDTAGPSNIAYHNGAQAHTNNGSTRQSLQTEFTLAARNSGPTNNQSVCSIADLAIWHGEIISAAEMASMDAGFSPPLVHPSGLVGYYPLVRDGNNVVASDSLTTTGTGGIVAHPPVFYPAAPYIITPPAVVAGVPDYVISNAIGFN